MVGRAGVGVGAGAWMVGRAGVGREGAGSGVETTGRVWIVGRVGARVGGV